MTSRRAFLLGTASLVAAPAIVRASSLMQLGKTYCPSDGIALYATHHPFNPDDTTFEWQEVNLGFSIETRTVIMPTRGPSSGLIKLLETERKLVERHFENIMTRGSHEY
jgi:hypothetical protein